MDDLDKHFLLSRNAQNPTGQQRNQQLRQPGRISNAYGLFSMNFESPGYAEHTPIGMSLKGAAGACPAMGPNSNAIESKKLLLGQPQLISMSTAATYNVPRVIYNDNVRHVPEEM